MSKDNNEYSSNRFISDEIIEDFKKNYLKSDVMPTIKVRSGLMNSPAYTTEAFSRFNVDPNAANIEPNVETVVVKVKFTPSQTKAGQVRLDGKGGIEICVPIGWVVTDKTPTKINLPPAKITLIKEAAKQRCDEEGFFPLLSITHIVRPALAMDIAPYKDAPIGYQACKFYVPPSEEGAELEEVGSELMPEDWKWANNPSEHGMCINEKMIAANEGHEAALTGCSGMPNQMLCSEYSTTSTSVEITTKSKTLPAIAVRTVNPNHGTVRTEYFSTDTKSDQALRVSIPTIDNVVISREEQTQDNVCNTESRSPLRIAAKS